MFIKVCLLGSLGLGLLSSGWFGSGSGFGRAWGLFRLVVVFWGFFWRGCVWLFLRRVFRRFRLFLMRLPS